VQSPRNRYSVDFSSGYYTALPHLGKLKGLAELAGYEALLAHQSKTAAGAANSIILMSGLAGTLDNEPIPLSQLVRVAILKLSVRTLEQSLTGKSLPDVELSLVASAFARAEKTI